MDKMDKMEKVNKVLVKNFEAEIYKEKGIVVNKCQKIDEFRELMCKKLERESKGLESLEPSDLAIRIAFLSEIVAYIALVSDLDDEVMDICIENAKKENEGFSMGYWVEKSDVIEGLENPISDPDKEDDYDDHNEETE